MTDRDGADLASYVAPGVDIVEKPMRHAGSASEEIGDWSEGGMLANRSVRCNRPALRAGARKTGGM